MGEFNNRLLSKELNNKLLSQDSTVVALVISKLVEYIQEQYAKGEESVQAVSYLKDKCVSQEERISAVAVDGILKLLEIGIINPDELLEELITLIPSSKVSRGMVKAISCTLYHQFKGKKDASYIKFNLHLSQHPFIILLNKDPEYLPYIHDEIRNAYKSSEECFIWDTLHYSFYQFCICNPDNNELNFYKMNLWTTLIQASADTKLITQLISWIPFDTTCSILVTTELLDDLTQLSLRDAIKINRQVLLIVQISALYHLVSGNYNPRNTLKSIELLIGSMSIIEFANAILLILVKIIIKSSVVHVMEILEICELLILQPIVNVFILESVKMSLLHWIGNPSSLSSKVVTKAGEMYLFIQNCLKTEREPDNRFQLLYKKYGNLIISNQELYMACKLTILANSWKSKDCVFQFLMKLKTVNRNFIKKIIHLVFGLFVSNSSDPDVVLLAFDIICFHLKHFERFSHLVLTLILYRLSNTSNSNVHFKLLKYLPELARTNENYLKIVSTINVLFNSADIALKTLGMSLMCDLWIITNKAYPYLEDVLTSSVEGNMRNILEFYINKAYMIKKICENNAQIYGADMVAHLSRILNKCTREEELASAIAIDAITDLCKESIVDIETTWTTLAPKFTEDGRSKTIESLLGLAAAMSNLLHLEEHAKLQEDVIKKVWFYALKEDLRAKKAAFNALAEFGLENISPYFPEQYRDEPSVVQGDIMNVFLVPGYCWIKMLKNQSNLQATGDFLIKMISNEIDEFPKSVYHVASMKEPFNYSYLPAHSILRGITEYCRLQALKWRGICKPMYIECLRILSQEFSKPLPPYNWCYLQELFHEPELRTYCVNLASHQVMISGTARRLMENYISGITTNLSTEAEVLLICKNLKFLANSIQPTILRPFFRNTLNYGKKLLEEERKEFLTSVVTFLSAVLVDSNIQEVCKREIVANIDEILDSAKTSDELFDILLNCVIHYPPKFLQNSMKLLNSSEITPKIYERACKIGCSIALQPNETLKRLDDLIDVGTTNPHLKCPMTGFLHVLKLKSNQAENVQWILELIGKIEAAVGDSNKTSLLFLLHILVVSLVVFSGFHVISDSNFYFQEYLLMLPQSAALIMNMEEWYTYTPKVVECIYYLNINNKGLVPEMYQNIFGYTLQALRYHPEFKKNNKWMKYLGSIIKFNNYI